MLTRRSHQTKENPTDSPGNTLALTFSGNNIETVGQMICGGLVVLDNGPVHAIGGNALRPSLQQDIRRVKGSGRGITQPVGCTVPFDDPFLADIFEAEEITNVSMRQLFTDPAEQAKRLGGVTFIRGAIRPDRQDIPEAMVSRPDASNPEHRILQLYSPEGQPMTEAVIREVRDRQGLPVMTSANESGTPELVDRDQAKAFAKKHGLLYVSSSSQEEKPLRPRGSYPIGEAQYSADKRQWEWVWTRTGCFAPALLLKLVDDMPSRIDDTRKQAYPDNVLGLDHLPGRWRLRTAKNEELRKRMLETIIKAAT